MITFLQSPNNVSEIKIIWLKEEEANKTGFVSNMFKVKERKRG